MLILISQVFEMLEISISLLNSSGLSITQTALHEPTLDDVFLTLTGHKAEVTDL
jgi:hypothetical protein